MVEVVIIADSRGKNYAFAGQIYEYIKAKEGRDFDITITDVERMDFKDKEFKLKIRDNIRRRKCFFIHDSNKLPSDWFTELTFALEAMTFSDPSEITVVLPYTKFARQERKDESRVSVNAKVLADTISLYATRGMTVDLHNPSIQEYFSIPFDNLYSFSTVVSYLIEKHPEMLENLVVVSPDMGGAKRAEALVKRLSKKGIKSEVALGHKSREIDNQVSGLVIIGEVENKNCLIIDDMIDTGNTMIKTAEELKKRGAKAVFAYGTHGLFTDGLDKLSIFDKIFTSDTIYHEPSGKVEVVSLVSLFGEAIYRTIMGESLSVLFQDRKEVN